MAYLFESPARFADTIRDWYPFPARASCLYPNNPSLDNPNFPVGRPPKPIRSLGIGRTTARSLIVAIEEYQSIMWRVRPTAWPRMTHDKRQIADIRLHMSGLLQTMKCIIPDHLHEVPGPLKETIDCLAQSLIRLESINPDIRGQWRTFNDVSTYTSSNIYQEILNLTNMKLRQLKDMTIGDTFTSPVEDIEAQSAAAMIIESTAPRQETAQTDTASKRSPKFWGMSLNFNIFRKRKQRVPTPTPQPSPGLEAQPETPPPFIPFLPPSPVEVDRSDWCVPPIPSSPSTDFTKDTEDSSYIHFRPIPIPIPGASYHYTDIPKIQSPVLGVLYLSVSNNAIIPPIQIGTPSSSPTNVAIREAAEEYRRKKALEVELQPRPKKKATGPANRARMARAAARRVAMNSRTNPNPNPSFSANVGETQYTEHVGQPTTTRVGAPKPPPRVHTTRPKQLRVRHTRVRLVRGRPTGEDNENVPTALAPAATPQASPAKQAVPKNGSNPVSLLSLGA
ncbi:uncharacterized protein DFL_003099 [Arthrobotrys flagrans]|uniref:Uncharacterized protein n=1 Tax=Arthrobotrys flagrans TaxID=97331 RepID=A0A437ACE3_ARTFL|nr:hypothetical protein DFL_003099 [Arthrobotrys flagrans]